MGVLDNSTNNIVIDAVLTDRGRQYLARNDGSFSVTKFGLTDDGVDYNTLTKFGLTVGKEKIVKNSPIFEAQTREFVAVRNQLISVSNPSLIRFPNLTSQILAGTAYIDLTVPNLTAKAQAEVIIKQSITNQLVIPSELVDSAFEVIVDNRFLSIPNASARIDANGNARYMLRQDPTNTATGGGKLTLTIGSVPIPRFSLFASVSDSSVIITYVTVKGWYSGSQVVIEARISNTT
jgi:hypothetical protein